MNSRPADALHHQAVGIDDIAAAAQRLQAWLKPSPVLENEHLNQLSGRRVLLKAESLMPTGSFKIRGALNRMLQLTAAEQELGVVAFSSGNHAQGVAQAARWLGISATVVMPADAPQVKLEGTRALGARVVLYDRLKEDREAIAHQLATEGGGCPLVPAFDDPRVVAGTGTIGLELVDYLTRYGITPGLAAAPCSGGGLIAGVGLAMRHSFADIALYAIEPEGYDDTARSLAAGRPIALEHFPPSRCDGLLVRQPGDLTLHINKQQLTGALTVSDGDVEDAQQFARRHLKLVLEPSGAAALAALLQGKLPQGTDPAVVILSGGNVDE
jgi:threonine dehydratase